MTSFNLNLLKFQVVMLTGKFLLVDKVRSKVRNLGLHLADGVEGGHVLDVEALHILLTTQHCYIICTG